MMVIINGGNKSMRLKEIKSQSLSKVFNVGGENGIPTLSSLCKSTGKWGMFIRLIGKNAPIEEYIKAAPYLKSEENDSILVNGFGYFLFDHEDDMEYAYDLTVGEAGPTEWNDYKGPAIVNAVTCGPQGILINENSRS